IMNFVHGVMGMRHFFFQAEDGIRDPLVTGVQTCALPISAKRLLPFLPSSREHNVQLTVSLQVPELFRDIRHPSDSFGPALPLIRSEERRVGKEVNSRVDRTAWSKWRTMEWQCCAQSEEAC